VNKDYYNKEILTLPPNFAFKISVRRAKVALVRLKQNSRYDST